MTIEKGKYLNPFRTQKSSPSSPMVLHARVWKSRSSPSFFLRDSRDSIDHRDYRDQRDSIDLGTLKKIHPILNLSLFYLSLRFIFDSTFISFNSRSFDAAFIHFHLFHHFVLCPLYLKLKHLLITLYSLPFFLYHSFPLVIKTKLFKFFSFSSLKDLKSL